MTQRVRPQGRISRRVAGAANSLGRHTLFLGLVVAAVGAMLAAVAYQSVNGVPFQDRYELKAHVPADAPIIRAGDAVRIAGRLAGIVTEVSPIEGGSEVEMELTPSHAPVGRDVSASIRIKSLIGLTYVELHPGNVDDPLPEGETIPVGRIDKGVDILQIVELFDEEARQALREAAFNAGIGLAGRGVAVNEMLGDLPVAVEEGEPLLAALTEETGTLGELIVSLRRLNRGLRGERDDDPGAVVESGSEAIGALANRSEELGQTLELLRPVSDELLTTAPLADAFLEEIPPLSAALTEPFEALVAGLPELNAVLASGDQLREEIDRQVALMLPAIEAAIPVVVDLQPTVASVEPLLEPLNRLLDTISLYENDVITSAKGLISATMKQYPEGQTAPGANALRFSPVFTCHTNRSPYPGPGEPAKDSAPC
jgi:ABC-type transporter Mla subunit MlaD